MDKSVESSLQIICRELINDLNTKYGKISGMCYLTGFVLERAFTSLGYDSKEITGVLQLKDINGKWFIYGPDKYQKIGKLVGYYHTWCTVIIDEVDYIVDPSPITMKLFLKKMNIKLSKYLPDYVISPMNKGVSFIYEVDETLKSQPQLFLDRIPEADKEEFISNTIYRIKSQFKL